MDVPALHFGYYLQYFVAGTPCLLATMVCPTSHFTSRHACLLASFTCLHSIIYSTSHHNKGYSSWVVSPTCQIFKKYRISLNLKKKNFTLLISLRHYKYFLLRELVKNWRFGFRSDQISLDLEFQSINILKFGCHFVRKMIWNKSNQINSTSDNLIIIPHTYSTGKHPSHTSNEHSRHPNITVPTD